jgi:hypothetical protein
LDLDAGTTAVAGGVIAPIKARIPADVAPLADMVPFKTASAPRDTAPFTNALPLNCAAAPSVRAA